MRLVAKKMINTFKFFLNVYVLNKKVVLIYQMGKVGSTTIYESIKNIDGLYCLHVHRITQAGIDKVGIGFSNKGLALPIHLFIGNLVRKHFFSNRKMGNRKKIIITLVREPVERNFSAYFENMTKWNLNNPNTDQLIESFIQDYDHSIPLEWFDDEFKVATGIDIYDYDFSKEKGWLILEKENSKVLILKVECTYQEKIKALSQILELDDIKLVNKNVGNSKTYAEEYNDFKSTITLPNSYFSLMSQSKYSDFFYSESERESIRQKYLN
jgi:hypothetical protein